MATVLVSVVAHPVRLPSQDPVPQCPHPCPGTDSLTCCLISGCPAALAVSSSAGSEVGENGSQQEGKEWGTRQEGGSCVLKDVMFSSCFCVTMLVFSKSPSLRAFQLYRSESVSEGRECSLIGCLANPPLI